MFEIVLVFIAADVCYTLSWDFSQCNVSDDVTIWKFAVWRNRAFFAVPRWGDNSRCHPTLLEAPWYPDQPPELSLLHPPHSTVSAYPSVEIQASGNLCTNLISIVGVDVDNRGRLWVLDSPESTRCPAKIVLFDLRRNEEICRDNLRGIAKEGLRNLLVDPVVGPRGYRAYIGDPGDNSILIYNIDHTGLRTWWTVKLRPPVDHPKIISTDLAICRKNQLFITGGNFLDLFSVNLELLRSEHSQALVPPQTTNTTYHGIKMGVSSGLLCDPKGGLHYFLVTEHASVRWDTKHDLKAGSHAVLLQSEQALSLTDYRMDAQRNVWGLVNARHPYLGEYGNCRATGKLSDRIVRVFKYNLLAP
ncbi:uncharacterized protein LOC107040770 [Diachasma alloeum]|uniref:uncharacterized protein LOC107040770 n=1 Tax=Diachasma alloeum TaxID=454923 RepID=UPI0007381A4C|nr:uncharacterized protein LOC107040770 [Diachasma alloeum]